MVLYGLMQETYVSALPEKVRDVLRDTDEGCVLLVETQKKRAEEVELAILKLIRNKRGMPGVVVSLGRENKLASALKEEEINDIIFIESKCKTPKRTDNCLDVGSSASLTDIAISIEEALFSITTRRKFLLFHSVETLLSNHGRGEVVGFFRFLTDSLRKKKVTAILIATGANKGLLESIGPLCDNTLLIGGRKK